MGYSIDAVKADRTFVREAIKELPQISDGKEMSHFDLAFISSLIKEKRPAKVVEVGTSAGGSCAVMLRSLHDLGIDAEVHVVDLLTYVYHDKTRDAGWLAIEEADLLGMERPHMHLGVVLPQVIEEIGEGIDFLVLDTTHSVPGEILEFLVALPYLSDGAIVCMHDIRQQYRGAKYSTSFATTLLMSSVVADKLISTDDKRSHGYPNIGAFRVTEQTREHVANVAQALTVPWNYRLDDAQLAHYRRGVAANGEDVLWFFDHAVLLNEELWGRELLSRRTRRKIRLAISDGVGIVRDHAMGLLRRR